MIRPQAADGKKFSTHYPFFVCLIVKVGDTPLCICNSIICHKQEKHTCTLDNVKTLNVSYKCLSILQKTCFFTDTRTKAYTELLLLQKPWLFSYILKSTESDFLSSTDLFSSFTESSNLNVRYNSLKHLFNHCVVATKLN
jgi:hypothetical protein